MTAARPVAVSGRLPRGRHGLSRESVVDSQRGRVLEAMIAAVNEGGYHVTSIVEVAHRAGVSRKTVYELFDDKEGCLLAAHELLVAELLAAVRPAWERPEAWSEKVSGALAGILTAIAERPQGARLALVEMLAAGPRARARHRALIAALVRFLDEGRGETPLGAKLPRSVSRIVVGGAAALVYERVAAGRASELPDLQGELLALVLLPYLGPEHVLRDTKTAGGAAKRCGPQRDERAAGCR